MPASTTAHKATENAQRPNQSIESAAARLRADNALARIFGGRPTDMQTSPLAHSLTHSLTLPRKFRAHIDVTQVLCASALQSGPQMEATIDSNSRQRSSSGLLRRNFDPGLAVEHDLAVHRAFTRKPRARLLGNKLGHLHSDIDGVTDFHRRAEIQGLRNIN